MQCTANNAYQNYWVSCACVFSFLKDWRCSEMFPLSVLQFAVMSSMTCQCIRNWYMECVILAVADLLCSLVINYSGIWLYLHSVIGKEHKIYDVGTVSNRSFTYKESSFQLQPFLVQKLHESGFNTSFHSQWSMGSFPLYMTKNLSAPRPSLGPATVCENRQRGQSPEDRWWCPFLLTWCWWWSRCDWCSSSKSEVSLFSYACKALPYFLPLMVL